MITRAWKVYGLLGHRQRESFSASHRHDFSDENGVRIIEILNSDITGTNDYCVVRITRSTAEECEKELDGQISDGFFENTRCGVAEEIPGDTVFNASKAEISFNAAVGLMDDEIREALHAEGIASEQAFFSAYEAAHLAKFGEEWELSKANPIF